MNHMGETKDRWCYNKIMRCLFLLCGALVISSQVLAESSEQPQKVILAQSLVNKPQLLFTPQGNPQVLWGERRSVHLAELSRGGWRELLPDNLASAAAPIGAYNQQGELYVFVQPKSFGEPLFLYTISSSGLPRQVGEFQWQDNFAQEFFMPSTTDYPLHLIFQSIEWRWSLWSPFGFLSGHPQASYGKYFSAQWDGQRWTKPVQIVDRGKFHVLNIACAPGVSPYVACIWTDSRHGQESSTLVFAAYGGKHWSKNIELGEGQRGFLGMELAIAVGPESRITIAFVPKDQRENEVASSRGLLVQERRAGTWGPVQRLTERIQGAPALSIDPQGRAHVIWHDGVQVYHRMQAREAWTAPTVLLRTAVDQLSPLTFGPDGQAHLVWTTRSDQVDPTFGPRDEVWYQSFRFE
jgi:hypothetical protein